MNRKYAGQQCSLFALLLFISTIPCIASSATFLPLDSATMGNWPGVYGHDGYIIANDADNPPSYATLSSSGATPYTWVNPSTDPRALWTSPTSSTRIASTFDGSSFSFNINLTDGQTHQLALYLLDLDTTSRVETISILDSTTNNVLDTRTLSGFHNGTWAIWDLQGHVIVQVTWVGGLNAVVSGLFFDPVPGAGSSTPPPSISITSPSSGAVSGTVTVAATASAAAGVASVQFRLDGSNLGSAITGAGPYSVSWNTTTATNGSHNLTAVATDILNQSTTSSPVAVTVSNSSPGGGPSATFLTTDATTKGNWPGVYGAAGYVIAADANNAPSFATLNLNSAPAYTWADSTTDPRALLTGPSTTARLASTYYSSTSMTWDLNLTDGQVHPFALYCLDYDYQKRTQTITIVDASTGAVLDGPRNVTNFSGGEYLVWNLQGHIQIQIANTGDLNAVVGGLFFGNAVSGTTNTPPTVSMTAPTSGMTVSGTITVSATASATTAGATISSVQFQLDGSNLGTAITGAGPYSISWNTTTASNASHTLTAIATDTLNQSTTSAGDTVTVSNNSSSSGTSATFLTTDTTTKGSWPGVYGGAGYTLAGGASSLPTFAGLNLNAPLEYTWYASTTDPRALLDGPSTSARIAATWYSSTSMTFDLNLTDGQAHQFAMYCLDDDYQNRSETITIVNASTGAVLDGPRSVTSFSGGVYLVWNLQGNIEIQIANAGGVNAVVSGLFFGNASTVITNTPPTVSMTAPTGGTTVSGTIMVSATASATTAGATISSVQFQLDGANLGTAITGSGPYSISWNTTTASNASHVLMAIATDSLNQKTTSTGVTITVSNVASISSATFLTTDTTTQGSWKMVYGQDGYDIASDSNNPPSYASVSFSGATQYAWAVTSDPRALQQGSGTSRIASAYYGVPGFTLNINLTDGNVHELALYFLDWDNEGRSETVTILNANTQAVLDTRIVSGFQTGKYLIWNVQGKLTIQFSLNAGANAVMSGLFLSTPAALNSPILSLSTTSVGFSGAVNGANPTGQSVAISNLGTGTLNWTATKTQSWLTLSAASGTAPSSLGLSVVIAGLSAGTYTDTVTITAIGAAGSPQTVSITLTITPAPSLSLSGASVTFNGTTGGADPTSQSVTITNIGGGTLNWTATKTQSWLILSATAGMAPSSLGLSISNTGLGSGTYTDTITINAPGAIGAPQTVSVTLNLAAQPIISLSTTGLNPQGTVNGANPSPTTVTITNTGAGTLNWTATKTQSWVVLSATGGAAPANLQISYQTAGLAAGTYSDTVTIACAGAINTPQTISINLTMAAPGPPLAYWTFDTGTITGNTVEDTSGNGIYGTIVGKVTPVPGEINQAVAFDGSTGYIYTAPTASLTMRNDMTIAAWIQTTNSTRTEVLAEDYNLDGSEDGYIFETTSGGYVALHLGGLNITGTRDVIDGTNQINDGKWHHVAVIIRPGQDVSFYVDGGLSSVYYLTISYASTVNSFGLGGPALGGGYLFTGAMDDARVYNYALSTAQIEGLYGGMVTTVPGGQILYNGIAMPKNFPPPTTPSQMYRTPYYINNPPRVIPINVGRQLFVDNFLIAQTTLTQTQHQPVILPSNPIFTPGAPISGGAFYDPSDSLYKMWYYNTTNDYRYIYSQDGMNWTIPSYPDVLVPNTNEVVPGGDTVWLDLLETDPTKRYKAFQVDAGDNLVYMYFSADGIHWGPQQNFNIETLSDRTTFFYNPFRGVWVNSDRSAAGVPATTARAAYDPRVRFYSESTDLTTWNPQNPQNSFMTGPDDHDPPYYLNNPGGEPPELYNMDAVAYESVMVGLFSWFYPGYPYENYTLPGPILVELGAGFSRDGFSWVRPTRGSGPGPGGAFIPASDTAGTWNAYNTQSVGGGFLVVGDNLYFYFSARTLQKPLDGVFSTGLAELRRDGFYSMDAGSTQGTLITNPVAFTGNHMFVNVNDPSGSLYVEVLDQNGNVIPPFSMSNCVPISVNKTLQEVTWTGASDLSAIAGQPVQFKFYLTNGELYSFWVTPSAQGASYGYVAAGGPGFTGVTDTVGSANQ